MGGGYSGGYSDYEMPVKEDYNNPDTCQSLSFEVTLSSVDARVLSAVIIGEILPVVATSVRGPLVVMKEDRILGTVLSSKEAALLTCIQNGTEYQAKIISINGGECKVKIYAQK